MLTQFDEKTQKIIVIAESIAFDKGHSSVGSEHLLLSLLKIKDTPFSKVLKEYNVDASMIDEDIERLFGKKEHHPFYMEYSEKTRKILDDAISMSIAKKEKKVSVNHLSLALLMQEECVAIELLKKYHVPINKVKKVLSKDKSYIHELDQIHELTNLNKKMKVSDRLFVGRSEELEQLCSTLCKKEKNNALIVGKAGVGKSALVENLALMINNNEVVDLLKDKIIYELNLSAIVAGTKYRGEFEEKLKKIIDKILRVKDVIIFIDEIHNLIGAGGAEGAIDASNILKPYLARKELTIIGATTLEEYYKYFEKDQAMNRRFSLIKMKENTKEETKAILKGLKKQYESYHKIHIKDDLLDVIIDMCEDYLLQRVFPDKALDVLDLACVKAVFLNHKDLSIQHIEQVIEELSGIKIIHQYDYNKLKQLLVKDVIGQEQSIHRLIQSMHTLSLYPTKNKPKGVYMFVGHSGVGKTYLARMLAKHMDRHLIKVDMSEYNSINKIIGSAPGYIGYNEQSSFLKELVLYPHSIVLLDEIEKASIEVIRLFLQVFDDGIIKDNHDRIVSFKDSIIIMTSNVYVTNNQTVGFKKNQLSLTTLKDYFSEEFINRIDEIIVFDQLEKESLKDILMIHSPMTLNDEMINEILKDYSLHHGVRGLLNDMKRYIVNHSGNY